MKNASNSFFNRHPSASMAAVIGLFVLMESFFNSFCSAVCPAFNDPHFDAWFPYNNGQALYFSSNLNNKDTIAITEVYRSEEEKSSGYGSRCYIYGSISSANQDFDLYFSQSGTQINFKLYDLNFSASGLKDTGFIFQPYQPYTRQFYTTLQLGNVNYTSVQEVARDTSFSKTTGIYKVWLAYKKGIIAYEQYPSGERWMKQ